MQSKQNVCIGPILALFTGLLLVTCDQSSQTSNPAGSLPAAFKHNATEIACGQTITINTTLTEDLTCPSGTVSALRMATSSITLDLGGHVISGNSDSGSGCGVLVENADRITIGNGTIEGFPGAIDVFSVKKLTLENLTIRNLTITDPDQYIFGFGIHGCSEVVIRNSVFEFPPVAHKEAVVLYDSDFTVDNIELNGGSVAVNYSFANRCDPLNGGVTGSVLNSRFFDVSISGVLVQCTTDALISGNEFIRNEVGVQAYGPCFGSITGLNITGNEIHDGFIGIDFMGVTQSGITNNVITNNWRGIWMNQNMACIMGDTTNQCFYSTGNVIADNVVTRNFIDLYHHEKAVGNTWERNTCIIKEGAEIPECTTGVTTGVDDEL